MLHTLIPSRSTACIALVFLLAGKDVKAEGDHPAPVKEPWFGIHVVDEHTGRGVPLIELRTVNDIRFVTDNAGWIAFLEPGLMNREVWFTISGPGYGKEKDGFGNAGARATPVAGGTTTIKLHRTNIAERVGRSTGQGMYRDSELLGLPVPVPNLSAGVMGQDSARVSPYHDRLFWLWGDTNVPQYPLGTFHTTAATTPLDIDPRQGIKYEYLMDPADPGKARQMFPRNKPGAIWLHGLFTVTDEAGKEVLLAQWSRHQELSKVDEQGIARFNDERGVFESAVDIDVKETWRLPIGNAVKLTFAEGSFVYFAEPFCHTRVKATLKDALNPASYEALRYDTVATKWLWQRDLAPTTQEDEAVMLRKGLMPRKDARYVFADVGTGKHVRLHAGGIQPIEGGKFILIGEQIGNKGDPSAFGEVWFAEARSIGGPWDKAVKVATHPGYSFYNPVLHTSLAGGIYFEGTYSVTFSGNPFPQMRYDYNQLLYRLDLGDERLKDVLK